MSGADDESSTPNLDRLRAWVGDAPAEDESRANGAEIFAAIQRYVTGDDPAGPWDEPKARATAERLGRLLEERRIILRTIRMHGAEGAAALSALEGLGAWSPGRAGSLERLLVIDGLLRGIGQQIGEAADTVLAGYASPKRQRAAAAVEAHRVLAAVLTELRAGPIDAKFPDAVSTHTRAYLKALCRRAGARGKVEANLAKQINDAVFRKDLAKRRAKPTGLATRVLDASKVIPRGTLEAHRRELGVADPDVQARSKKSAKRGPRKPREP